jgi:hypothetical protein
MLTFGMVALMVSQLASGRNSRVFLPDENTTRQPFRRVLRVFQTETVKVLRLQGLAVGSQYAW